MVRTSPISALPRIIEKHRRRVMKAGEDAIRDGLVSAQRTAVLTTRVDTGKARSNWIPTLFAPASVVIPPYAPGNSLGKSERANAGAAIDRAKRVAKGWNIRVSPFAYIANNVPYIGILNAKDDMLALAVQSGLLGIRDTFTRSVKTGRRVRPG